MAIDGTGTRSNRGWFREIEDRGAVWLRRCAQRPIAATALIAAMSLTGVAGITAVAGIPEPEVHDELAQLVQADIFAQGRLVEAPHPLWRHFETIHVLSQPRYQAKFPPGLPIFMALGQTLTGAPIAGVWLAVMLMIVSTGYGAQAWLPRRWALLTTALVALRFGFVGDWAQSYWGGAIAASGGALVFGAVGRLRHAATIRDGAILGAGLVLLAFSRPFEGLVFGLTMVATLTGLLIWPSSERRRLWQYAVPAAAVVIGAGLMWLGYYNWRVTGSPATLPYTAYERQYSAAPLFVWQPIRTTEPAFHNREMQRMERTFAMRGALHAKAGWPGQQITELGGALWNYTKPTLLIALLGIPFAARSFRRTAIVSGVSVVVVLVVMSFAVWQAPRYMAPLTTPLFVLVSIGLAGLSRIRFGRLRGRTLALVVVSVFVASVAAYAARYVVTNRTSDEWWVEKRRIREQLLRSGGDDLVFVRYGPSHNVHREWVYNGADIDHQPIVWSREIDPVSDRQLREYFNGRHAWVVSVDQKPVTLTEWKP